MSEAWKLYELTQERCEKYAGMVGQARGTARLAIMDIRHGDSDNAIALLQKLLDAMEAAFPPLDMSTLERPA